MRERASSKRSTANAYHTPRGNVSPASPPGGHAREAEAPSRLPAGGGHPARERLEEAFVDRVDGLLAGRALGLVAQEADALLGGVGELAEAVAQLDAGDVELEALGDPRIARLLPRERRLRGRVFGDEDAAVERREAGLDLECELLEERVLVVLGEP